MTFTLEQWEQEYAWHPGMASVVLDRLLFRTRQTETGSLQHRRYLLVGFLSYIDFGHLGSLRAFRFPHICNDLGLRDPYLMLHSKDKERQWQLLGVY